MTSPKYNIKELIIAHDDSAKLLFAMWEILALCEYGELTKEEQTILDAWNFDSTFGNGLCDLLANENYDVIAAGFEALRSLSHPRLTEFADSLERVFGDYGISCETGDEIAKLEQLSGRERSQLEKQIGTAEGPFLNEIWGDGLIHAASRRFIEENIRAFDQRNVA